MKRKEIEILIEKYLDGMTTNAEEDRLRRYFAEVPTDDMPEEWRVYKALFAWETGHVTAGDAATETVVEVKGLTEHAVTDERQAATVKDKAATRPAVMRRLNVLLASAAASVAILIVLTIGHVPQTGRQCYAVIDGRVYTDCEFVEREAEEALMLVAGSEDDAFDALRMMRPGGGDMTDDEE